MKVVINTKTGGYRLSDELINLYYTKKGFKFVAREDPHRIAYSYYVDPKNPDEWLGGADIPRHDSELIKLIKELGNSVCRADTCRLKIVEIPDGVEYIIVENYDGSEYIAEKHRTWD